MIRRSFILCVLLVATHLGRAAGTVSIAAAANLVYAIDALNAEFKKATPDTVVTVTTGASGSLVAQIKHGAPFDVFLSADLDYPRALVTEKLADEKFSLTFATGKLVLWTTRPALALESIPALVRDPTVKKIAVANLTTAPYGRAAQQALQKLGVWADAQPKLVIGENISQTVQFVETGNADAGFIALSVVLAPNFNSKGRWVEVPADLYARLDHGAVLTNRGVTNAAARSYLEFLRSAAARKILERFGYSVPASP